MVARVGVDADPPIPSPRPLRPLLGFARLPDRALAAVKQVLDNDEEFRSRVALAADEGELGRASYLYLARPDGWEEEVAGLEAAADAEASSAQEEQEERSARRRSKPRNGPTRRSRRLGPTWPSPPGSWSPNGALAGPPTISSPRYRPG
jgi:hypothetical protein